MSEGILHHPAMAVLAWLGLATFWVACGVLGARLSTWLDRRRDRRRGWPS